MNKDLENKMNLDKEKERLRMKSEKIKKIMKIIKSKRDKEERERE